MCHKNVWRSESRDGGVRGRRREAAAWRGVLAGAVRGNAVWGPLTASAGLWARTGAALCSRWRIRPRGENPSHQDPSPHPAPGVPRARAPSPPSPTFPSPGCEPRKNYRFHLTDEETEAETLAPSPTRAEALEPQGTLDPREPPGLTPTESCSNSRSQWAEQKSAQGQEGPSPRLDQVRVRPEGPGLQEVSPLAVQALGSGHIAQHGDTEMVTSWGSGFLPQPV